MAIEIIKKGRNLNPKYEAECPTCDCVFSYQEEDVYAWDSNRNIRYAKICCPHCDSKFYTDFDNAKRLEQ